MTLGQLLSHHLYDDVWNRFIQQYSTPLKGKRSRFFEFQGIATEIFAKTPGEEEGVWMAADYWFCHCPCQFVQKEEKCSFCGDEREVASYEFLGDILREACNPQEELGF